MSPRATRRPAVWAHGALFAVLMAMAGAACGGAAAGPPPQSPSAPGAPAAPGEAAPAASAQPGAAVAPGTSATASTPVGPAPSAVEMKAVAPTAMVDDLRALGLDAKNLPPIEKLEPRTLRGVMKLMARSLGVKCGDCHLEGDFAAPTRRKKIAAHMWDEFAAKLSSNDGAPLFCDSCHQGRTTLLDRRDKKALSQWMDENFVTNVQRKDGKSEECESCHVDMDMHFLAKWGQ